MDCESFLLFEVMFDLLLLNELTNAEKIIAARANHLENATYIIYFIILC